MATESQHSQKKIWQVALMSAGTCATCSTKVSFCEITRFAAVLIVSRLMYTNADTYSFNTMAATGINPAGKSGLLACFPPMHGGS